MEVTAIIIAQNFVGPGGKLSVSGDISGNYDFQTGTEATWSWFVDTENNLGSFAWMPGTNVANGTFTPASDAVNSGSYNQDIDNYSYDNNALFSMAEEMTFLIAPGGTIDNAEILIDTVDVPEPGSLLLLGTSMIAISLVRRRPRSLLRQSTHF
jgi:hypothetical protein